MKKLARQREKESVHCCNGENGKASNGDSIGSSRIAVTVSAAEATTTAEAKQEYCEEYEPYNSKDERASS